MGIRAIMGILFRTALDVVIVTSFILFVPGIPPYISFDAYNITPAAPLEGKLAPNNVLSQAEALLKDKILGPESIALRGEEIYTGVIGGDVIRLKNGNMEVIARFGGDCEGQWEESKCGRPLGMRFGRDGKLVVLDAYYGLFSVDVETGKIETLVSSKDEIMGKTPKIPNDLDIAKDGTIFWSDSSTNVNLQDATIEVLGCASGRLLKYDMKTKTSTVLLQGLHFVNGVQLSKNEDFVLVAETMRSRVLKYHLKGPKAGSHEIFLDGLPGAPDNIRSNGRGLIYIALVAPRYAEKFNILDTLAPHPYVRKFVLRLMCLVKAALSGIQSLGYIEFIEKAQYWLGHLEPAASILPKHSIILEVDEMGNIISTLQSANGKVPSISQITIDEEGKYAYLGSPYNTEIWKIRMEDVHPHPKIPEVTLR